MGHLIHISSWRSRPNISLFPTSWADMKQSLPGWCFSNPNQKNMSQNEKIFPNFRGENKKYLSCHHLVTLVHLYLDSTLTCSVDCIAKPWCCGGKTTVDGAVDIVFSTFSVAGRTKVHQTKNRILFCRKLRKGSCCSNLKTRWCVLRLPSVLVDIWGWRTIWSNVPGKC